MNNIDIWYDMGNLYLKANALDAAIESYNKAIGQGYQTAEIYKNLAGAYANHGEILESIPLYQKSIDLFSEPEEKALVFTKMGDSYRRLSDFDNAIAAYKAAIDMQPGNPALCVGLGDVQRDLENLYGVDGSEDSEAVATPEVDEAVEVFNTDALQPVPLDSTNDFFDENPGLQPLTWELITNAPVGGVAADDQLGEYSDETGQNLDSETDPEKENGVQATLLLTLGIMHWRNGNLDEADGSLQSAINYSVKIKNHWLEALSWHALALVKTALGDIVAAINAYLKAVELAPEQIFPWNNLGSLYGNMGSHDKALDAFQKVIRQNPEDSDGWDGLGDIFTKLGRMDDAIAAYQLGNVFNKHAQGVDAITTYEKALDFYQFTISSFENEIADSQTICENLSGASELISSAPDKHGLSSADEKNENITVSTSGLTSLLGEDEITLAPTGQPGSELGVLDEAGDVSLDAVVLDEGLIIVSDLGDQPVEQKNESVESQQEVLSESNFVIQPADIDTQETSAFLVAEDLFSVPEIIEASAEGLVENQALIAGELVESVVTAPTEDGKNIQTEEYQPESTFVDAVQRDGLSDEAQVVHSEIETQDNITEKLKTKQEEMLPPVVTVVHPPVFAQSPERIAGTIASCEAVVRENPLSERAWDTLGNVYRISQRNVEAINAYKHAVALAPGKYIYHYQLGALYAAEGNFKDAIGELLQVVELNPSFIFAHCALASYMRKIGKLAEAQAHIAIALPHMANEKEYDRACFESIRGNVDKSLELLAIALEKQQTTIEWIRRDLDLDFIRQDNRYKQFEAYFSQSVAHI